MEIRLYERGDAEAILKLFKDTILSVNLGDYSKEQCEVWANSFAGIDDLDIRLKNSFAVLAVMNGEVVGFGSLNDLREIDLLYTHKNDQGRGIGSAILKELEAHAHMKGYGDLLTEASLTARSFFQANGYVEVRKQNKLVRGTNFINFIMKKTL